MDDLVKRLKEGDDLTTRIEAAARISALEAENKRLVDEVNRQREFICKRCYLRTEEGVKPDVSF